MGEDKVRYRIRNKEYDDLLPLWSETESETDGGVGVGDDE